MWRERRPRLVSSVCFFLKLLSIGAGSVILQRTLVRFPAKTNNEGVGTAYNVQKVSMPTEVYSPTVRMSQSWAYYMPVSTVAGPQLMVWYGWSWKKEARSRCLLMGKKEVKADYLGLDFIPAMCGQYCLYWSRHCCGRQFNILVDWPRMVWRCASWCFRGTPIDLPTSWSGTVEKLTGCT